MEVVARARIAHPRAGIAGAPVDLVQHGIVGRGHPHRYAARAPRLPGPRLAAGLARGRNGVRPPELAAGVGVERDDEAAYAEPAARHPDHDHPLDGERRHGDVVAGGRVRDPAIPDRLPGRRVQRDHRRVGGADEDMVPVQGDAAVHLVAVLGRVLRQLPDVAPQEIAGRRIEREHLKAAVVLGHGDEHVSVVDDGRRLVVPIGAGGEGPYRLEGGDVGGRDPIERAVAPAVVGAAVHRPVARLGIQKPLGGHRRVLRTDRVAGHRRQGEPRDNGQHDGVTQGRRHHNPPSRPSMSVQRVRMT